MHRRRGRGESAPAVALAAAAAIVAAALAAPVVLLVARIDAPSLVGMAGRRQAALLLTTLEVSVAAVAASVAIGLPGAFLLATGRFPGSRVLDRLSLGMVAVPPYIHAMAWSVLAEPDRALAGWRGLLQTPAGAGVILGLALAPIMMQLAAHGMRDGSRTQVEAAVLARGRWAAFRHVVMPAAWPSIAAAAALVFALAAGNFGVPEHLRVRVYAVEVMSLFGVQGDPAAAAGTALPLAMIPLAAGLAAAVWLARRDPRGCSDRLAISSGLDGPIGSFALLTLLGAAGGVPLLALSGRMQGPRDVLDAVRALGPTLGSNAAIAATAGAAAAVFGAAIALAGRWGRPRWVASAAAFAALFAFTLPESVVAIASVCWLSESLARPALYGTGAGLALVLALRYTPLAWALTAGALAAVDRAQEEAAVLADVGLIPFLRRVVLPQAAGAVAAAGLLVAALSLTDLDTALVMTPPGTTPLGVRLFNMIHYGLDSLLAAAILVVVVTVTITAALASSLLAREAP